MILGVFNRLSRRELEQKCRELNDLVEKQQVEIEGKDRQIRHLSDNARKWSQKYQALEVTMSELSVEHSELGDIDNSEHKQLQRMLIKLNSKNAKLVKRMAEMKKLIEETKVDSELKGNTDQVADSSANQTPAETDEKKTKKINNDQEEVDLKFSPEMQNLLEKHAAKCAKHDDQVSYETN